MRPAISCSRGLSQLDGIGQVTIGGSALPAVRVEINPHALSKYGVGLEDVRAALAAANANSPKGAIEGDGRHLQIYTNDQANHAADYRPLVIAYRNGAPVHLTDVAEVDDSVEDLRNEGLVNGKPGIILLLFRQPGANIIKTVDARQGGAAAPPSPRCRPRSTSSLAADRSNTIRASLQDTEWTLTIAIALVTLIVFLFLRDIRATLIPAIAVPLSIVGTFGAMYLAGFSLNILSLMALTIATGFVVDDAIVVLENVTRYLEAGMRPVEAALARRRRGRLHRDVDQHLAYRRFHPDPFHGRHSRPAVPRIRRDAVVRDSDLARAVADADADDVRAAAQAARLRRGRQAPVRSARSAASRLRAHARLGAAP